MLCSLIVIKPLILADIGNHILIAHDSSYEIMMLHIVFLLSLPP